MLRLNIRLLLETFFLFLLRHVCHKKYWDQCTEPGFFNVCFTIKTSQELHGTKDTAKMQRLTLTVQSEGQSPMKTITKQDLTFI